VCEHKTAGAVSWKVAAKRIAKDAPKAALAAAAKTQAVATMKKRAAPLAPTRRTVPSTRSPPALASAEKNRRKSKPVMQEPRGLF